MDRGLVATLFYLLYLVFHCSSSSYSNFSRFLFTLLIVIFIIIIVITKSTSPLNTILLIRDSLLSWQRLPYNPIAIRHDFRMGGISLAP